MHFPPVLNGLDYLESSITFLAGHEPDARSLKYATLHLQAAVEVLFKARLAMVHEKLLWLEEGEYDARKHAEGDFKSIGWEQAVKRLKQRCAPKTRLGPPREFRALTRMRNRLQHMRVTDSDATAVEALSIPVLDTLLSFVVYDLLPHDSSSDWPSARAALERIRAGTAPVLALVERRLTPLREHLERHRGCTVACLSCGRFTVMLDGSNVVVCALCGRDYGDPGEAVWEYAGSSEYEVGTGGQSSVHMRKEYGKIPATSVGTASSPDDPVVICFADGTDYEGVCESCGQAVNFAIPEAQMCQNCADIQYARF